MFQSSPLHDLEPLAVHAGYGHAHAAHVEHQVAVAVDAHHVALKARQEARGDAQQGVAAGVVVEGAQQEADAFGGGVEHAHERAHHCVGDDGRTPAGAVVDQMVARQAAVKVGLEGPRRALQEDEPADGGMLHLADATRMPAAFVAHAPVNEMRHAVERKAPGEGFDFGVMDEKIAPGGDVRK